MEMAEEKQEEDRWGLGIVRVIQDEIVQVGRGSTKQKLQETMRNLDFILGAMESR